MKSLRTRMATDYMKFGEHVDPLSAQRGDVVVEGRHMTRPETGHLGHVGIASGPAQMHNGQMTIPVISGDYANKVNAHDWARMNAVVRRAPQGAAQPARAADTRLADARARLARR